MEFKLVINQKTVKHNFAIHHNFPFTILGETIESTEVIVTFNKILDIIKTCNDLSNSFVNEKRVENANEYVMDAQILKMSHDLLGTTSEKIGNCDFNEEEYIQCLLELLNNDEGKEKLAEIAADSCNAVNFVMPMLGTFDYNAPPKPEKERKERQKASKQSNAQLKAPENITKISKSDHGAKKINIVRTEISRICKEEKTNQLPYYKLICDPSSFMKSVDMAFQISFLIRDGFLGLTKIDDEPFVVIHESNKNRTTNRSRGNMETKQCVMSLNPKMWKQKVEQFNLRKPFMKSMNSENGDDSNESRSSLGQHEMEIDSD